MTTPTIPWGEEAFPADGSGRAIEINAGDSVRFKSIDDKKHNIAEAFVDSNCDDSGSCTLDQLETPAWLRLDEPVLNLETIKSRRNMDEHVTFDYPGVYYLVSPIGTQHKIIRLKVTVHHVPPPASVPQPRQAKSKQPGEFYSSGANEAKPATRQPGEFYSPAAKPANEAKPAKPVTRQPGEFYSPAAKPAKPVTRQPREFYSPANAKPDNAKPDNAKPDNANAATAKPANAKPANAKPANAKPKKINPPVPADDRIKSIMDKLGKKATWTNMLDVSAYVDPSKSIGPLGPVA